MNEDNWFPISGDGEGTLELRDNTGAFLKTLPEVQGLLTVHHDPISQNTFIVVRDGSERPILAIKMSRVRFAWFIQNEMRCILNDYVSLGRNVSWMVGLAESINASSSTSNDVETPVKGDE